MAWLEGGGAVASVSAAKGGDQKVWTQRRRRRRRWWSGGHLGWLFFQVSVQAKEVSIDPKVQEEEVVHLIARLLIAANPGKR